jgi:hypothetical protein
VLFEKVFFVWNKGALQPGRVLHRIIWQIESKDCRQQADECYRQQGRNVNDLTMDNDGKGKLLLRVA